MAEIDLFAPMADAPMPEALEFPRGVVVAGRYIGPARWRRRIKPLRMTTRERKRLRRQLRHTARLFAHDPAHGAGLMREARNG